jgi:drug/metabolite transporter (DMT)-like permease
MPYVLLSMALVILSQAGIMVRLAAADALAICFWRLFIASLVLLPIVWFRDGGIRQLQRLNSQTRARLVFSGISLFLHFYFFFRAVQLTTIGAATLVFCLNPLSTAIGARLFFGERLSRTTGAALLLGLASVAILVLAPGQNLKMMAASNGLAGVGENLNPGISSDRSDGQRTDVDAADQTHSNVYLNSQPSNDKTSHPDGSQLSFYSYFNSTDFFGILAGLASAIFFSCYILSGKSVRESLSNFSFSFSIYATTALVSALAMVFLKVSFFGYSQTTWMAVFGLALLPTLMGHAVLTYCLKYIKINIISCATLIEPALAAASALLLFHEPVSSWFGLSLILATTSVMILFWPERYKIDLKKTLKRSRALSPATVKSPNLNPKEKS